MFEKKAQELREKADMLQILGDIYERVNRDMQYNAMKWHDADEEHTDCWFTEYDEDEMTDYTKAQLKAYKMVLQAIEKMVK